MTEAIKTLLYLSLCGTALGLALAIVQRLVGRRLPSRFYYFAWLVVLARFALPIPGLVATEQTAAEPATTTVSQPLRMAQRRLSSEVQHPEIKRDNPQISV